MDSRFTDFTGELPGSASNVRLSFNLTANLTSFRGFVLVSGIFFSRSSNCASNALSLCPQFGNCVLHCSFATALLQSLRPCSRYQQGNSSDSDGLGFKPKQLGLLPVLLHAYVAESL